MNKKVRVVGFLKSLSRWWPHVAVALVVPGGIVLAVLLWICRHRQLGSDEGGSDTHGDSAHSIGGAA